MVFLPDRIRWITAAASLLFLAPAAIVLAQSEAPATFRSDVNLVNVTFTVEDKNGALQSNLSKDDFVVLEDGVPQQIRAFSRERNTPLSLGIVLDFTGSQYGLERSNRDAAVQFLRDVLHEKDTAFIAGFDRRVKLFQDSTPSLVDLDRALDGGASLLGASPYLGPAKFHLRGSPIHDAIYYAAREKMKRQSGRKALLLISDGLDNASHESVSDTIEMLQSADTVLYALNSGTGAAGKAIRLMAPESFLFMRNHMSRIALETGGQEFKLQANDADQIFHRIEEQLRTMYTIGYVSSNSARDGKFRKIQISVRTPDYTVRARQGYRAPNADARAH
jgi:VWFA-related protein